MKELKNKRTYTTKHFDKGDGSFVIEAFNKPVHYKDENGQLQDVDLTIIDKGDYYDVAKTEFSIRVQKNFLASDFLQYKNRYKGGKHILSFEPAPLVWFNKKDWSDEVIVGQPQNIKGVVEGNKIIYKNAYGEGFDFEITILLTGFRKEIVIQNNSFLSTKPTKQHELVLLFKHTNNELPIKTKKESKTDVINVKDKLKKIKYTEHTEGFNIGDKKKTHIFSGSILSNSLLKSEKIKLFWTEKKGDLYLGKILPQSFLETAEYPIRADSTINGTISQDNWLDANQPDNNWNGSLTFFRTGDQGGPDGARGIARFIMPSDPGGGVSVDKVEVQFKQLVANYVTNPFVVNLYEDNGGAKSTGWGETTSTWNKYDGSNTWTAAGAASDFESAVVDSCIATHDNDGSFISWVVLGTGATNPITITWDDTLNLLLKDITAVGSDQLDLYKDEEAAGNIGKIVVTYSVVVSSNNAPMFGCNF